MRRRSARPFSSFFAVREERRPLARGVDGIMGSSGRRPRIDPRAFAASRYAVAAAERGPVSRLLRPHFPKRGRVKDISVRGLMRDAVVRSDLLEIRGRRFDTRFLSLDRVVSSPTFDVVSGAHRNETDETRSRRTSTVMFKRDPR